MKKYIYFSCILFTHASSFTMGSSSSSDEITKLTKLTNNLQNALRISSQQAKQIESLTKQNTEFSTQLTMIALAQEDPAQNNDSELNIQKLTFERTIANLRHENTELITQINKNFTNYQNALEKKEAIIEAEKDRYMDLYNNVTNSTHQNPRETNIYKVLSERTTEKLQLQNENLALKKEKTEYHKTLIGTSVMLIAVTYGATSLYYNYNKPC